MKYLVYDIGGTSIKHAIMRSNDEILSQGSQKTPTDSKDDFLNIIKEIYDNVTEEISGIAVSMPGQIDASNAYAITAGALPYLEKCDIAALFHTFTDLPVSVENDGKCAALAESIYGSLKDTNDGVVLLFGTGVGGGIIKDGKLHKGANFSSGEFSLILNTNSEGKLEPFALKSSVYRLFGEIAFVKNIAQDQMNGLKAFELINQKDPEACAVLSRYCDDIAVQIMNLQYIYDPERFAIGGGISAQPAFLNELKAAIDRLVPQLMFVFGKPEIVECHYRNDANLVGALINFQISNVKTK